MKKIKLIVCFVLISFFAAAQSAIVGRPKSGGDSSNLKRVKIGEQVWSAENLNTDRFPNGDLIPEMKTDEEWERAGKNKQPGWCYYNNDPANGDVYGKLYNWYAVADPRGLCPSGWHVPFVDEWKVVSEYLGGSEIAGGKMKEVGISHWTFPNIDATNTSGFTGLPGGFKHYLVGLSEDFIFGAWWSCTPSSEANAYASVLSNVEVVLDMRYWDKDYGFSVRCIKD